VCVCTSEWLQKISATQYGQRQSESLGDGRITKLIVSRRYLVQHGKSPPSLSGGCYWIFAPGHLAFETMRHLGVRPPGDNLLVLGHWLTWKGHLLETIEPNHWQFFDGTELLSCKYGERLGNPVSSVNATWVWKHGCGLWWLVSAHCGLKVHLICLQVDKENILLEVVSVSPREGGLVLWCFSCLVNCFCFPAESISSFLWIWKPGFCCFSLVILCKSQKQSVPFQF
jgi:hypothetical protein